MLIVVELSVGIWQYMFDVAWVNGALFVEFLLTVGLLALTPRLRRRPRANTGCDLPDDDAFRCHA
ncbi:hypothetical protein ACQP2X_14970 [Actinoplanes sp. CA-131856]